MTPTELFHSHLDICDHCMNHPFDLCDAGQKLLRDVAGEMAIKGGEDPDEVNERLKQMANEARALFDGIKDQIGQMHAEVTTELDDDTAETIGTLFGMPVRVVKPMDCNRIYYRRCNAPESECSGHFVVLALNTGIGVELGINVNGQEQQLRFMDPKKAKSRFQETDRDIKKNGYHLVYAGGTLFDDRPKSLPG